MSGLKQEMDQTLERIECMEYRFAERSGDIEEAVGSCETRVYIFLIYLSFLSVYSIFVILCLL